MARIYIHLHAQTFDVLWSGMKVLWFYFSVQLKELAILPRDLRLRNILA